MKPSVVGLLVSLAIAAVLCVPGSAQEDASNFPSKPACCIVSVTPETGTDLSLRLSARETDKFLKQPIVAVTQPTGIFISAMGLPELPVTYCGSDVGSSFFA